MSRFENWDLSSSEKGELINNLIIIDKIVESLNRSAAPVFYILGGAALMLNGINYKSTLDIDTANRISDDIKEEISMFIDDAASEVVVLPTHYETRLIPFMENDLESIRVFILSNEDLVFTKLASDRRKDLAQLRTTNILLKIDVALLNKIINEECSNSVIQLRLEWKLKELGLS